MQETEVGPICRKRDSGAIEWIVEILHSIIMFTDYDTW